MRYLTILGFICAVILATLKFHALRADLNLATTERDVLYCTLIEDQIKDTKYNCDRFR